MARRNRSSPALPSRRSPRRSLHASPTPPSSRTSNDKLVDLTYPLTADATVRIVTNKNPEALEVYRHSTAHLLAAAVTALFPKVQCGIGPPIEDGFFYDFIVERPFVPEDLEAIEAKMKELASKDYVYERQMWPRQEAIDFFTKRGEPLKVQLIEEKTAGQPEVSVYTIKDKDTFLDFCVGPHVPSTGRLKAFKLTATSNAYWKGDAKNAPMQRVYGTAFFIAEGARRAPDAPRGSEEARPPQARQGARPVHVPPVGAGRRRSGRARARRSTTRSPTTCAASSSPPATRRSRRRSSTTRRCGSTSGHWSHYRENMFLVEVARTATRWASRR